jgi:hypothetical protein
MKALSIRQPWAWAIVSGLKTVENRSWRTNYRGPVLIHAGRSRADLMPILPDGTPVPENLRFGYLLGVAELVDCVPLEVVPPDPFAEGPWCWILRNARPLARPVPYVGRLLFFEVPDQAISL